MYFLIAILLIIVIIFGVASGMQSYATAQQAQAQIEVAKAGQVNAWGNLITILILMLTILVVLAFLAALLWTMYRRSVRQSVISRQHLTPSTFVPPPPPPSLETLIQLETLRMLRSLNPPISTPALTDSSAPSEEQMAPVDDPFYWLK
jgi:hypothetical protein